MGSSAGFVIPSRANAAPPPKAEMCRLEGRDYTKMLLENSDLKGIPGPSNRFGDVCNFATHSGKTMKHRVANHSFNCALGGGR
jgi:hypothetical protein